MALQHGEERFTKWIHMENGDTKVRRLHRLEVQARDGRLYILTGNELPDTFVSNAGRGYRGAHLAQILLSPETISEPQVKQPYQPPPVRFWPVGRDVVHVVAGFVGAVLLKLFVSAASATF